MSTLQRNTFSSNRNRHFRRNLQLNGHPKAEADIVVTQHLHAFGIAITIRHQGRVIARNFRLTKPGEASSEERAWLIGYALAWGRLDEHLPDARLYIAEPEAGRRRAA